VSFESIRERHTRLESMTHTQSTELRQEMSSQAHEDRGWLIQALEAATLQNDELTRELGRLEAAVDELGARPAPKRKKRQEEAVA
jgi:hypothetical protein